MPNSPQEYFRQSERRKLFFAQSGNTVVNGWCFAGGYSILRGFSLQKQVVCVADIQLGYNVVFGVHLAHEYTHSKVKHFLEIFDNGFEVYVPFQVGKPWCFIWLSTETIARSNVHAYFLFSSTDVVPPAIALAQ